MQPQPRPYVAPAWLPGGHLQTLYPALLAPRAPCPPMRRLRIPTPDQDFFDIDFLDGGESARHGLVLFHGLEGSLRSHYVASLAQACQQRGWRFALVYFRGCSGGPNLLPRAYHAGDSAAIDAGLQSVLTHFPSTRWFACGISLGGNALLKYLADTPEAPVAGAVAVSAPLDLCAAGQALDHALLNRWLYTRHFLSTLKTKALAKVDAANGCLNRSAIAKAKTLYAFDDAYTAPIHGYAGVTDYWRRASALPDLPRLVHPVLLINARNDPFLPASALPQRAHGQASLILEQPEEGGHVGFVEGRFPGHLNWLPNRLFHFFEHGN